MKCLYSSPQEEHQHKVLEEGSTDTTEDRIGGSIGSKDEDKVHSHQSKTEVDENLLMLLLAQIPKITKLCVSLKMNYYS